MKKFFTLIIVFMAIALPMTAKDSGNKPNPTPIILESTPNNNHPNPTIPRAPMRISVEAWYDAASETISILYDGYSLGEVFLFRNGELVDRSSEINTTLQTYGSEFITSVRHLSLTDVI